MEGILVLPGGRKSDLPAARAGIYRLVVVFMMVPPIPVLLLLILVEATIVAMRVPVIFHDPLLIVNSFMAIPVVVVTVIRIVHPVSCASGGHQRCNQSAGDQYQTKPS